MGFVSWMFGKGRRSAKNSNLPRTEAGAAERVRLNKSGEADRKTPATQMLKKGGVVKKTAAKKSDMVGRALKRKTADTMGRAMGMKKSGKATKKGK